MKLNSPTIYVPHKVNGKWARSAFSFTGLVDKRRIKREIIKSFRKGGETVSPLYIDHCIIASLSAVNKVVVSSQPLASIEDAENAALAERAAAEQRQFYKDEHATETTD